MSEQMKLSKAIGAVLNRMSRDLPGPTIEALYVWRGRAAEVEEELAVRERAQQLAAEDKHISFKFGQMLLQARQEREGGPQ